MASFSRSHYHLPCTCATTCYFCHVVQPNLNKNVILEIRLFGWLHCTRVKGSVVLLVDEVLKCHDNSSSSSATTLLQYIMISFVIEQLATVILCPYLRFNPSLAIICTIKSSMLALNYVGRSNTGENS